MNGSKPSDVKICIGKFDGRLIIDYEVCFLQHFCETCPQYDDTLCDTTCNKMGTVKRLADMNGCKTTISNCECKCIDPNCNNTCKGTYFRLKMNNNGCNECECLCPHLDCDASCGKTGLGIAGPKDQAGCSAICSGCRGRNGKVYCYSKKINSNRSKF